MFPGLWLVSGDKAFQAVRGMLKHVLISHPGTAFEKI